MLQRLRKSGTQEALTQERVWGPIVERRGLFWARFGISTDQGRVWIRGVPKGPIAQQWSDGLREWQAPIIQRKLAAGREIVDEAMQRLQACAACNHFVRHSELTRAQEAGQTAIAEWQSRNLTWCEHGTDRQRLETLRQLIADSPPARDQANERFIAQELEGHARLFDTVESKPLTAAQRRACVVNDDHNLVLAGAGTGKTSVMIGRVGYLLAAELASPDSVLMVAYNRDAAEELRERAAKRLGVLAPPDALTIKTFHALGVELIAQAEGVRPSLSVLAEDSHALARFVTGTLDELLNDPAYAEKYIEYGWDAQQTHRSIFEFPSMEAYERELARVELRTIRGERVKSFEELQIANFPTRKGIAYHYEAPFPVSTATQQRRQYRPDFTIPREGSDRGPLFLEHFGVDAKGQPPPFFSAEQATAYREQMVWKSELYRRHRWALIETYSFEFQNGTVFDKLAGALASQGIQSEPLVQQACLEILRKAGVVAESAQYFATLIPVVRERAVDPSEVPTRITALPEGDTRRARLLWALLQPILERYEEELRKRGEIDFAEMIRRATDYVRGARVVSPYRQILVDEFQDISAPRAELTLALARSRAETVVFCVGDDWQSIYRFAGSDVRYTSEFERLVGAGTTTALDQTFRFNDQIGRVASKFVMRNPAQVRKDLSSVVKVDKAAVSLIKTAEPVLALDAVLAKINGWAASRGVAYSVYVLARYRHELDLLKKFAATGRTGRYPHLSAVKMSTVHGAKGLEADFVVVVGLGEGRHGFPADKPVDAFQEIFLPPRESFEFAEERRLFYVALTRAKHRVFLLYDAVSHSPFIRELKREGYPIVENDLFGPIVQPSLPIVRCPRCATGEVRPRSGENGTYYACHRFPACRYRERGCGTCGDMLLRIGDYAVCSRPSCDGVHLACTKCGAPMDRRSGPHSVFFGCSNYGRVDLIEQCSATQPWRELPDAASLRAARRSKS